MNIPENFSDFLKEQAEKMQSKMEKLQQDQIKKRFKGVAGAGLVEVEMNGRHEVTNIILDRELLSEPLTVMADLIKMAFNDALTKVDSDAKAQVADLTSFMMSDKDKG